MRHKLYRLHSSAKKHYKKIFISIFTIAFLAVLLGGYHYLRGSTPYASELAFMEYSVFGKSAGSVIPASCVSDVNYTTSNVNPSYVKNSLRYGWFYHSSGVNGDGSIDRGCSTICSSNQTQQLTDTEYRCSAYESCQTTDAGDSCTTGAAATAWQTTRPTCYFPSVRESRPVYSCVNNPNGTITAGNCTIDSGDSTCNSTVVWDINYSSSPRVYRDSTSVSTSATGNRTFSVGYGSHSFTARHGSGTVLDTNGMTASCVSGTTWTGSRCSPPNGTITAGNCTIASGASSCNSAVSWDINYSSSPRVYEDNTSVSTSATGNRTFSVDYGSHSFTARHGSGTVLDTDSMTASCVSGTTWTGSRCSPPTGTVSATNCTIAISASTCTTTVTWTINYASTPRMYQGNTLVSSSATGNTTRTAQYGTNTFTVRNGSSNTLDTHSMTASCASGSTWDGSECSGPSGTITASNCTIAVNASTCSSTVTWEIENASTPRMYQGNTIVSTDADDSLSRTIPYGTTVFTTRNGSTILDTDNATASCASGSSWDGSECVPPPPTGTINATSCTIAVNASTCSTALTWTINNSATPRVYLGSIQISTSATGNTSRAMTYGSHTFTARDGASSILDTDSMTASCASGSTWNGTECNAAPTVTISPTTSNIDLGDTITYTITGSDANGNLTGLSYNWDSPGQSQWNWENGNLGGTASPTYFTSFSARNSRTFTFDFTPTVAGTYRFYGASQDADGVYGTSPVYTFTVTDPPSCANGGVTGAPCCVGTSYWDAATATCYAQCTGTITVGPRSVRRGDYVTVTYDIKNPSVVCDIVVEERPVARITATNCVIPAGGSTCTTRVEWDMDNVTTPRVYGDGTLQWSTNPGNRTLSVSRGAHIFDARNGASVTIEKAIMTADCAAGTSWDGNSCEIATITATANITGTNCVIPAGGSTCTTTVNWTINGATTPRVYQDNTLRWSGASGSQTRSISRGAHLFDARDGATETVDSVTVTADCAAGTSWDGNSCETETTPPMVPCQMTANCPPTTVPNDPDGQRPIPPAIHEPTTGNEATGVFKYQVFDDTSFGIRFGTSTVTSKTIIYIVDQNEG